ncbi:MAG: TatD family deoxyribonuclease [Chloroflexi bacterium]|nr:TatD family deoxyribonuclease [Chloroflexota bacterium]MBM3165902.1 TatD family deoxyribonuclease [Chloroflexota bacterium]MBM4452027.1 TatD family deoxyribonuclease [Chloroflexota bacterium]
MQLQKRHMIQLIDTHAHLDELEVLESALAAAQEAGIVAIVAVGSGQESNQKLIEIHHAYPQLVYPALGLHPWELGKMEPSQIDSSIEFIRGKINGVVAIGEIGLDYDKRVVKIASKDLQKAVLRRLLASARKYNKPVSVHCRYAWKDCLDIVKEAGIQKAVFHWFTGFSSVLKEIIDTGYFISATPAAEYHEEHRRAIRETPLEKLLLETDCPVTYGRENRYRSSPSDIVRSLKAVAAIKNVKEETVAQQTTRNAQALFNLKTEITYR